MRKPLSTLLIFLFSFSILQATNTFIQGKIQNPVSPNVHVKFLHNAFTNEYANLNFPIDANGEFHAELEIDVPTFAYLTYNGVKFEVYVEPQKDVGVFFVGDELESSIQFFESNQTQNNTTWRKYKSIYSKSADGVTKIIPSMFVLNAEYVKIKSLVNVDERFEWLQQEFKNKSKYFTDHIKVDEATTNSFKKFLYSHIYFHSLAKHQTFVPIDSLNTINRSEYQLLFEHQSINRPESLNHPMYLTFLDAYAINTAQQFTSEPIDYYKNETVLYQAVKQHSALEQPMKDQILGRLLYSNLHPSKLDKVKPLYINFIAEVQNDFIKKVIEVQYELANKFATGSPAPDFELENKYGETIKLSDLKGKKVYLLFWAKWCAYCKLEIKNSKKNRTELDDDEIEIVFISMDKLKSTWLEHSITKEEKELHLWGNTLHSNIKTAYGIVNLPLSFLIDEAGNFIREFPNSDNEAFVEFIRGL